MKHAFQIAIDGPVAAGKGTVSRLLAERLNFLYVDTGAMYRAAAWLANQNQVSITDGSAIAQLIPQNQIELRLPNESEQDGRLTTILVNGQDISWDIRNQHITDQVATVAAHPKVRVELVKLQQAIAQKTNVVMEGRDITYVVLPEADLKIYLDASESVRAKRRWQELTAKGIDITKDQVQHQLHDRDHQDMTRPDSPLRRTSDSWYLDTTQLSVDQVVGQIIERVHQLQHQS